MNIVYFGTDAFLNVFEYFKKEHNILALYTYHNNEDYFTERSIVQLAHISGIPVHYEKITEQQIVEFTESKGCELFFVAEYSSKIPIPKGLKNFRGINTHSALLPQGRSYYPIEITMAKHCSIGGVTLHKLAESLDSGDILAQNSFDIQPQDDSIDVYLKCAIAAKTMLAEIMTDFEGFWKNAKVQTTTLPYWKRPTVEEMLITHDMTVSIAMERYRCFNKMSMVTIDAMPHYIHSLMPGNVPIGNTDKDIIIINDRRVLFGLADGHIRIDIEPAQTEK
ncbi:formyltransferase family protein [Oscillospiraceae bacterium PP1C4]